MSLRFSYIDINPSDVCNVEIYLQKTVAGGGNGRRFKTAKKIPLGEIFFLTAQSNRSTRPTHSPVFVRTSTFQNIMPNKTHSVKNNDRYWWDCGSGRRDHWWHMSNVCLFPFVLLFKNPPPPRLNERNARLFICKCAPKIWCSSHPKRGPSRR